MRIKILLILLLGILLSAKIQAQTIVITEIMYNDPSSGTTGDSLEFIEFYNNTSAPIVMTGYQITTPVTYTFPSYTLANGQYVVVARHSSVADAFFGITGTQQWTTGSLPNNGGGTIVLKDSLGLTIDSVKYNNAAPWPTPPSGLGATLMLCDPNLDNNVGSNWITSSPQSANSYGVLNNMYIYATPGSGCIVSPTYVPVWAPIPFTENFDSTWINAHWLRDVPNNHWLDNPVIGNTSWRRNDDGISGSWTTATNGAYAISGASGSIHSARFHAANATAGTNGTMNLCLDFTTPGPKRLKFWYMNTSGTDSLNVFISIDSALTFTKLQKFTTATAWEQKQIDLGTSVSTHVVLQFRAYATNASGTSDIGLDGVSITLVQGDDAGITAITQPTPTLSNLTDTVKVNLNNFGSNNLTAAVLGWSVNGVIQPATNWGGNIAPGASENNIVLGTFTFPSTGISKIKAWSSQPNDNTDSDHSNDSTSLNVFYQSYAPIPYFQHFDSAWVSKLGTHDSPDFYWNNVVPTGNNSWRQANDGASAAWTNITNGAYTPAGANNTIQSARFHTAGNASGTKGTMDLYLDFTLPGTKELRFYQMNTNGTDSLAIWISRDGGTTFNYLTKFNIALTWTQRVVLLGDTVSSHVILRFRATANNAGTSDIGIDEVSVNLVQPDAGMLSVVSPFSDCDLSNAEAVTVKVKNFGNLPISNIPVMFDIDGVAGAGIITNTMQPGDTVQYTFTQTVNLSTPGPHVCKFVTAISNDANHNNDSLNVAVYNKPFVSTYPYTQDFEGSTFNGWSSAFITGLNEWALGTPTKTNLNTAHSGVNTWVTGLTANFHNNTNSYVSSPCFDLTTLALPSISVWINIFTNSNSDAMVLEASVNDSAWVKVGDSTFYNSMATNLPVAPPKWAGTNNGWTQYFYTAPALAHKAKVAFRFRFQSNATNNNEGIAFDDFRINDTTSVGIQDIQQNQGFTVYPNPAKDFVTIRFTAAVTNADIQVINELGQAVQSKKVLCQTQESFDLSKLPAGIYGIKVVSNGKTSLKKIIKY
ncbi:MAG: lamin tail domain-containing protein [Bacteroidota bacterium]